MYGLQKKNKMSEYKFHTNRQFGTEQFSLSVTVNTNGNSSMTDSEVTNIIGSLDTALYSQLVAVDTRSIKEREYLASQREAQAIAQGKLESALSKFKPEAEESDVVESPYANETEETN